LGAFEKLFKGVIKKNAQMILSYSNNGVMAVDEIIELANKNFTGEYEIDVQKNGSYS
jgi:adenine-specific DNA-methyltransferase